MRLNRFEWDNVNSDHINYHNIQSYEDEEVILFDKAIYDKARDHRFIAWGITENGRYLMIVLKYKGQGLVRVITAREMTEREKHNYKRRK